MSKVVDIYSLKEKVYEKETYQFHLGANTKTKEPVFIKIYSLKYLEKYQKYYYKIINEMHLVEGITSTKILRPLSYLKTSNNMYVIYDYFEEKSLKFLVQQSTKDQFYHQNMFNDNDQDFHEMVLLKLHYLKEMVACMIDLKADSIMHRNLKPSNYLSKLGFLVLINSFKFLADFIRFVNQTRMCVIVFLI